MQRNVLLRFAAAALAVAAASTAPAARAEPGTSDAVRGAAAANVVVPAQIEALEYLRFGRLQAPVVNGTVRITAAGVITSSFDLTAFPSTRGPARFWVRGDPNRQFITFVANSASLTNARGNVMTVNAFTINSVRFNLNRFNRAGRFDLFVGGTLNVAANQPVGSYSGDFEVSVLYL